MCGINPMRPQRLDAARFTRGSGQDFAPCKTEREKPAASKTVARLA